MKITKIALNNFRQFYGQQEIVLATDPKQNVTLVHAENGFGKTTILNAVLWAFYGHTTSKFEQPNEILNFEAEEEGERGATVEVEFSYNDNTYYVRRIFDNSSKKNFS